MRRLKVGILTNEVFDVTRGRIGGFGWAACAAAQQFQTRPELGVEPVLLTGELRDDGRGEARVHDTRLVLKPRSALLHAARLRAERLDLLLTIDWRRGYRLHALALPRTPLAVWVRDPRTPDDVLRIAGIRVPGAPGEIPAGVRSADARSLSGVARLAPWLRRPFALVTPEPALAAKVPGAYGLRGAAVALLPNPIALLRGAPAKSPRPTVVFVGRLDPVKRPWLVFELARRLPDVTFQVLGRPHLRWRPPPAPPNLELLGHLDGDDKAARLAGAWVLVNTSPHEGLAVSFLEALAAETPLAAFVDTGGVVSRFGLCAGPSEGAGTAELPALEAVLRRLLDDESLRVGLGRSGRAWVEAVHGPDPFAAGFVALRRRLGL